MLGKVIATGLIGLGISAVAMVRSAMPGENSLQVLQDQISNLTAAVLAQGRRDEERFNRDEERFNRIEEEIRQLRPGSDHTATIRPHPVQPITVRPTINVRPIITVQPPPHRHYYPRYVWCPPEWWGWGPPY
jgi:hypothetical protein